MCRTRNTDLVSTVMCTTSVFQLWKSCSSPCLPDCFFFFLYSADVVDTEVHLKKYIIIHLKQMVCTQI